MEDSVRHAEGGFKETIEEIYVDIDDREPSTQESATAENLGSMREDDTPLLRAASGSTVQDLLDIGETDNAGGRNCDKCDGNHKTEACPHYPMPRGSHEDAQRKWLDDDIPDITLPLTMHVVPQEGDGNCLFHAMVYTISKHMPHTMDGEQLRQKVADFFEDNMQPSRMGNTLKSGLHSYKKWE